MPLAGKERGSILVAKRSDSEVQIIGRSASHTKLRVRAGTAHRLQLFVWGGFAYHPTPKTQDSQYHLIFRPFIQCGVKSLPPTPASANASGYEKYVA
jgi:hypothetical protein